MYAFNQTQQHYAEGLKKLVQKTKLQIKGTRSYIPVIKQEAELFLIWESQKEKKKSLL